VREHHEEGDEYAHEISVEEVCTCLQKWRYRRPYAPLTLIYMHVQTTFLLLKK